MFATRISADSAGRRSNVCRLALCLAVLLAVGSVSVPVAASDPEPILHVDETDGIYRVAATFSVPQSPGAVLAVLTDYSAIPRFMSQVQTSVVLERSEGRALVEQSARARFLMFNKRIHLVLAVDELPSSLHFRDTGRQSFTRYEGSWQVDGHPAGTRVRYELTAKPAFSVPEFLLQRLLKRDAEQMVKGLAAEITRRTR